MMMELIQRYSQDEKIAELVPELNFLWGLAKRVKQQGCYCGLNREISAYTPEFNQIVENLAQGTIKELCQFLNRNELCFGILKPNKFYTKCYSNQGNT